MYLRFKCFIQKGKNFLEFLMSTHAHDTVAHKHHPILNKSTPFTKCTAKIVCGWWVDWEPSGLNLGCSNRTGHAE